MMDNSIRISAFNWLKRQTEIHGDVFTRISLETGFIFNNKQITLVGPKGIWKPKIMNLPLSITTISEGPYDDAFTKDGFLKYRYRGTNPNHPDNAGLRTLLKEKVPLIYFHNIVKGKYLAAWPVFIFQDNIKELTFTVAVDDVAYIKQPEIDQVEDEYPGYSRRSYLTSNIKLRLHQRSFREKVLLAYQNQCTLCRLKHTELLDAAHIIPDSEEQGLPIVQNGLSLCKIHHAAFDKNILGITPDYLIKVRKDILNEINGPMLKYGIQSLESNKLFLPKNNKDWPDKERLDYRYKLFLNAS